MTPSHFPSLRSVITNQSRISEIASFAADFWTDGSKRYSGSHSAWCGMRLSHCGHADCISTALAFSGKVTIYDMLNVARDGWWAAPFPSFVLSSFTTPGCAAVGTCPLPIGQRIFS